MNQSHNPEAKRINDIELARSMALAELPHEEERISALAEARRHAELANNAGIVAGKAYIASLRTEADILSEQVEAGVDKSNKDVDNSTTPETEKPDPWSEVDPTKLEKARKAQEALAKKFEPLGAKPEDFIPVFTKTDLEDVDGKPVRDNKGNIIQVDHTTVIYAGTKRLDIGNRNKGYDPARSWNSIMANDIANQDKHTIDIDGQKIDTRSATTIDVLRQMVTTAVDPKAYKEYVWRTGEPELAGRVDAPIADLRGGQVLGRQSVRDSGFDDIGLRPAVEIV